MWIIEKHEKSNDRYDNQNEKDWRLNERDVLSNAIYGWTNEHCIWVNGLHGWTNAKHD